MLLERCFDLARSGATVGGEVRGGLTTLLEGGFPALLTVTLMPFTYSITDGIGAGFVSYCAIKLLRGKGAEVHGMMYGAAAAFVIYFALPAVRALLRV